MRARPDRSAKFDLSRLRRVHGCQHCRTTIPGTFTYARPSDRDYRPRLDCQGIGTPGIQGDGRLPEVHKTYPHALQLGNIEIAFRIQHDRARLIKQRGGGRASITSVAPLTIARYG